MTSFCLPDLGEGLTEAEIVSWHVSRGDHVASGQPLVSVETDKAVVEIPAPRSGVIRELYGAPGDIVAVGAKLVDFEDAGRADTGTVVGELPKAVAPAAPKKASPAPAKHVRAAPAVRALAKELGVDLSAIAGTGPEGAITSRDVKAAAPASGGEAGTLRGVRRAMAISMAKSRDEVVPATVQDSANIEHWPEDADISIRLIRAVVAGIAAEPGLNAWFDTASGRLTLKPAIDLGVAMDRPEGLYVPVLRDVAAQSDAALRERLETLKREVGERTIAREDLIGQTFTLSNFGMIAGRYVSLVVVPPQVAILGAGRVESQPVVIAGEIRVSRMLPLSLTFDHRVVTGGEAARFLAAVIAELENETGSTGSGP